MAGLTLDTTVQARLDWTYQPGEPRIAALYERAKRAQWSAADVDWSVDVPFGEPLPDDSAFAMSAFRASPLSRYGRHMWDVFRWELQSWMVSQFLHGEQAALVVAGRLIESVPDLDGKFYAATQAMDEARHVEVFSRYLRENLGGGYPVSGPLEVLMVDILTDTRWDVTALGMQIMVEALAMAAFRLGDTTFHDGLVKQICRMVGRDEARHVTFGVMALSGLYGEMTAAERAVREDLVLEAASLIRRRFLLGDVWERLDVDRRAGVAFAATDPLMIAYRQAIFSRVGVALDQIGLLTARVRAGLAGMGLLGPSMSRIARRSQA
ncbi:MAG TPA: ferritin-like domain-containing protein [Rugosimonospora sp.]|nr:ferritin-like domain-containing protein [Rugosimonospora sp.]